VLIVLLWKKTTLDQDHIYGQQLILIFITEDRDHINIYAQIYSKINIYNRGLRPYLWPQLIFFFIDIGISIIKWIGVRVLELGFQNIGS
jgi:hypothetical protein